MSACTRTRIKGYVNDPKVIMEIMCILYLYNLKHSYCLSIKVSACSLRFPANVFYHLFLFHSPPPFLSILLGQCMRNWSFDSAQTKLLQPLWGVLRFLSSWTHTHTATQRVSFERQFDQIVATRSLQLHIGRWEVKLLAKPLESPMALSLMSWK